MQSEPHPRERELYACWEERALTGTSFRCSGGERIVVFSPGSRNDGPGPDYTGAVLLVDGALRSGAVEFHLAEEDWFSHRHHEDPAYAGVILHVLHRLPERVRLTVPTASIDALARPNGAPAVERIVPESRRQIAEDLLPELSWSRLLRRTIEVLRQEPHLPPEERFRRAFMRRLFDSLGYSRNRKPMTAVAERLLSMDDELAAATFDRVAALVYSVSGIDREAFTAAGAGFMSASRLAAITAADGAGGAGLTWVRATRPSNAPERRLWAASKLAFDLVHRDLLRHLLDRLRATGSIAEVEKMFLVRFGSEAFVGHERAREIVVNALLPVALAAAVASHDSKLAERSCVAYRTAPSLGSNGVIRNVEKRYCGGRELEGAFLQQGAIEFFQRYLSSDKSRLSFVAEPAGGQMYFPRPTGAGVRSFTRNRSIHPEPEAFT